MTKRKTTEKRAVPDEFRGRLWCVVKGQLFRYGSRKDFPGAWEQVDGFKVTGPNAASFIDRLYQQHATAFPEVKP